MTIQLFGNAPLSYGSALGVPDYPPGRPPCGAFTGDGWHFSRVWIQNSVHGESFPNYDKKHPLTETQKRERLLQKFYFSLLLDKFSVDKAEKKYAKLLSATVHNDITALADSLTSEPYLGWSIFMGEGVKAGSYCDVRYIGDDWYAASLPDVENSAVYVKIEGKGKKNKPVVTSILNPYQNLSIGDQENITALLGY